MREHHLSFKAAFTGIISALKTQVNLRIHLIAALLALGLGFYLKISRIELLVLILTISTVIVSEMANTALEELSDAVTTEYNEHIKITKDVAAGSVLLTALFSIIIGAIIFLPKLL